MLKGDVERLKTAKMARYDSRLAEDTSMFEHDHSIQRSKKNDRYQIENFGNSNSNRLDGDCGPDEVHAKMD